LIGYPISRSLTTYCVRLELRPRPSPGITRLHRYNEPLRLPRAPGPSLAGVRLVIPDHALGSPVLRTLSLCACCRHYPGAAAGRTASLIHPAVSAFPDNPVGSACASTFSRFARRSLALRPAHSRRSPKRDPLPEGFSHFVASIAAPVASGWSDRRVGLAPTGKRRLSTAHGYCGRDGGAMLGHRSRSSAAPLLTPGIPAGRAGGSNRFGSQTMLPALNPATSSPQSRQLGARRAAAATPTPRSRPSTNGTPAASRVLWRTFSVKE
jgi:hypothetical protein